jgi:gamma-glutamyl:cysteine ligase YbdK (ATP-grasp superfamily)
VTRIEDAVAIAAYCQALVKHLCERYEAGEEIPSYHRILITGRKSSDPHGSRARARLC